MLLKMIIVILLINISTSNANILCDDVNIEDIKLLNKAEYVIFGTNNQNLTPNAKLNLTENYLFGSTQPGTFKQRVNFIDNILAENQNAKVYKKFRKNFINNKLNELFNGTMTGFTPPIYYTEKFFK